MFGYTIKATDRDLARLTAERRKEFYHPHTIRVWERSGRNFHGRNAVAYLLPERALLLFGSQLLPLLGLAPPPQHTDSQPAPEHKEDGCP